MKKIVDVIKKNKLAIFILVLFGLLFLEDLELAKIVLGGLCIGIIYVYFRDKTP
jgi:hypothetical protein